MKALATPEFYRKGTSVKSSGPVSEPPNAENCIFLSSSPSQISAPTFQLWASEDLTLLKSLVLFQCFLPFTLATISVVFLVQFPFSREKYTPPPWHPSFLGLSPDPEATEQKQTMVYTIFLGEQWKREYTIGPERRVYTIKGFHGGGVCVFLPPPRFWENDFCTPPVLGGTALFDKSAPAVSKIRVLRAQDFYIPLALNCQKGSTSQHWSCIKISRFFSKDLAGSVQTNDLCVLEEKFPCCHQSSTGQEGQEGERVWGKEVVSERSIVFFWRFEILVIPESHKTCDRLAQLRAPSPKELKYAKSSSKVGFWACKAAEKCQKRTAELLFSYFSRTPRNLLLS